MNANAGHVPPFGIGQGDLVMRNSRQTREMAISGSVSTRTEPTGSRGITSSHGRSTIAMTVASGRADVFPAISR